MKLKRFVKPILTVAVLGGLGGTAWFTRDQWLPLLQPERPAVAEESTSTAAESDESKSAIILTDQAIDNLSLRAKSVRPQTYWKSIQVPGMVVDQPGRSDLGIITPVTGVVTRINFFPGETVSPGQELFTIRLLSELLHVTQSELFKSTQDIALAQATRERLAAAGDAIPQARIIEVDSQIKRLEIAVKSARRELLNRGLVPAQVDAAAVGNFVNHISVVAPSPPDHSVALTVAPAVIQTAGEPNALPQPVFEVQELKVDIGHQVQAGQTLCMLANHRILAIEGRAFRDETLMLERSVEQGWPVEVDFQERAGADWPDIEQTFYIRHIANTIDPANRTFGFRIPLENQSRSVVLDGNTQMLWRFRPGQRVRIMVPVEKLDEVFVLPADAVTRDLAEAFVFTQNVNTFERRPVRIVAEDRQHIVLANDGSLLPGSFVVQSAADQLNRMTKSQSGDGLPEGYHIHADGSLHKNEDEGK
ncbi:MAG: efflux RND transporter periplasmic adaptor subunit [Planctomycetota bacterium]|jgi:biotin carboxyl carrier protein